MLQIHDDEVIPRAAQGFRDQRAPTQTEAAEGRFAHPEEPFRFVRPHLNLLSV
jgi:hypothetical protein